MPTQRKRGRPPTFTRQQREQVAELIRRHGARGAEEISSIPISLHTVIKIAREFQIALKPGRRTGRAA